jgi:excisionase family DNA binding protein
VTPITLYRCFDASKTLLYVGISGQALSRFGQHRRGASWFKEVASVTVEHFPDRDSAHQAEVEAIRIERPLHNKVHSIVGVKSVALPADAADANSVKRLAYSVTEVAEMSGLSARTVHRLIKSGTIPSVTIGTRRLIRTEDLGALLQAAS